MVFNIWRCFVYVVILNVILFRQTFWSIQRAISRFFIHVNRDPDPHQEYCETYICAKSCSSIHQHKLIFLADKVIDN